MLAEDGAVRSTGVSVVNAKEKIHTGVRQTQRRTMFVSMVNQKRVEEKEAALTGQTRGEP